MPKEEAVNYIALAIPVFFLLIGVELLVQKMSKSKLYRFNDAVTNISCGVTQQVFGVFIKTILIVGYLYLYNNHRIFEDIPNTWWVWVLCFLGVDFFYYWFHRYAHEINFLWASHIVHHQSEEYNLSVALRQSAFQSFFSTVFYLPLGLIGFNPIMFVVVNQFQTLYQFWIHTRAIGKLPWLFEFVFNTPSHHRVHHGINPIYIDRNHGGTLIIWDRMFGTFQAEEEEVVYGITKPLESWNPLWAQVHYYIDLFRGAARIRRFADKIRYLLKPPGWQPEDLGGPLTVPEVDPGSFRKYDTVVPPGMNYYIFFQYVVVIAGTSGFLFFALKSPLWLQAFLAGVIFFSVANLGGLFELKRWALPAEFIRLLFAAAAFPIATFQTGMFFPALIASSVFLAASLLWMSRYIFVFREQEAEGQGLGAGD